MLDWSRLYVDTDDDVSDGRGAGMVVVAWWWWWCWGLGVGVGSVGDVSARPDECRKRKVDCDPTMPVRF